MQKLTVSMLVIERLPFYHDQYFRHNDITSAASAGTSHHSDSVDNELGLIELGHFMGPSIIT